MERFKLRATPVLKAMGFRYNKATGLYMRLLTHGARVYKKNDTERFIEIWEDRYDGYGNFCGRNQVIRDFPLDAEICKYEYYQDVFQFLALKFASPFLLIDFDYYLGLTGTKKALPGAGFLSLKVLADDPALITVSRNVNL